MSRGKDFKTRLKIAKKNLDAKSSLNKSKNASFMGNALRLGTELVAAVIKELEARKLKIENTIIESERVAEFSEKVKVSGDGSIFEALLISETRRRGILDDMDYQDYF